MNEQSFVEKKESDWKRLTELCDLADGRLTKLDSASLREFVRLYRKASADLAVARTKSRNMGLIDFLNDLTGRAYGILYRSPRKSVLRTLASCLAISAQTVRRRKTFIFVSAGIFFFSTFLSFFSLSIVPETREVLIPEDQAELFEHWTSGDREARTGSTSTAMAGMYASHNPRVAIMQASIGAATFGVGAVYLQYINGAMVGALSHEMWKVGKLGFLLSWIMPHGVTELSGGIIAGGAGLLFGWALINPGKRRRGDALRAVGKDGVALILTSVVLMFLAAPIEGYFSFDPAVPQWAKVALASGTAVAWTFFWVGFAKEPDARSLEDQQSHG